MAEREYRMKERAKAQNETRERILAATMQLHDEQGVAATSFVDIARRAGVGPATVYRHFETLGALVMACGSHVWAEMNPPRPDQADAVFEGLAETGVRLQRLAEELDRFYTRGALRLERAAADRDRIPELDTFLKAVEAGVEAWARAAVVVPDYGGEQPDVMLRRLVAVTSFGTWLAMARAGLDSGQRTELLHDIATCALERTGDAPSQTPDGD